MLLRKIGTYQRKTRQEGFLVVCAFIESYSTGDCMQGADTFTPTRRVRIDCYYKHCGRPMYLFATHKSIIPLPHAI